jgi:hypothetical protein
MLNTRRTSGADSRTSAIVGRARRSTGNRTTFVMPGNSSTRIAPLLQLALSIQRENMNLTPL